jgi:hypothetical protein
MVVVVAVAVEHQVGRPQADWAVAVHPPTAMVLQVLLIPVAVAVVQDLQQILMVEPEVPAL